MTYVDQLLEGLPSPADAPPGFFARIDPAMWPHVLAIAEQVTVPADVPTPAEAKLYLSALATIACRWWNPFKYGMTGTYADVPDVSPRQTYLGHNIAALAVDDDGRVVDFEMNHNDIFRSSAEHAEARLVRRLYQLANVHRTWDELTTEKEFVSNRIRLDRITVYTTLQPCAQCAGMMTLAQVRRAVFLQADPGMYLADVLMRALSPDHLRAPLPLPASVLGVDAYRQLNEAYTRFFNAKADIWTGPDGTTKGRDDMTAFLCTVTARDIMATLAGHLDAVAADAIAGTDRLDGPALVAELRDFVAYACSDGVMRGAPHRV